MIVVRSQVVRTHNPLHTSGPHRKLGVVASDVQSHPAWISRTRPRTGSREDPSRTRRVAPGSYRVRLLHLTSVWAYGVSQPIFSLVEGNASYLILRDSTREDAIAFALLVTLGVPLAAIVYVRLAALLSEWVGDILYLALLAAFLSPLALRFVKVERPRPDRGHHRGRRAVRSRSCELRTLAIGAPLRRVLDRAARDRLHLVPSRGAGDG